MKTMKKKTIHLAKETLRSLELAHGGAPGLTWSGCPMISCASCTDPCC